MSERDIKRIHFIGVGGVGMSGIASIAYRRGYEVSGSDMKQSRSCEKLIALGVQVFIGHDADNIDKTRPDVVVISSAIPKRNPELCRARELGLEVWQRARMLSYLGEGRKTLAVAGTHGKTTTSSMLATMLDRLGLNPTFLIGGTVDSYDTNAVEGGGEYYVVEADESDGSFVYLNPHIAIVTNIEADHLDHYGSIQAIEDTFLEFMGKVEQCGSLVVCGDDDRLKRLAEKSGKDVVTYGFGNSCDVQAEMLDTPSDLSVRPFSVRFPDGRHVRCALQKSPGVHNALNATGVLSCAWQLGLGLDEAAAALSKFSGVRRRFDHVASVGGVEIVDDYGHHPTEVAATLAAARQLGYRRIHVLFQPHRYTRTQALRPLFADAFKDADSVTFMDVYSAGEAPIPGVTGKTLLEACLCQHPKKRAAWMPHRSEIPAYMAGLAAPGDLLITMGAGDVTELGPIIADTIKRKAS